MWCWPSGYLWDLILDGEAHLYQGMLIRRQSYHGDYMCTLGRVSILDTDGMDSCTWVPTARRAWGPWPCLVVSGSKCHCFSSPWYVVKPIWYWKIPEWCDWMPRPIPGRGGMPAEQTGSEVLPVHIYHNEEKWRCGLFPSLVLFSLVTPPSSARSGGTIFDVACVALQPFAARGSQLYLVVWAVISGSWYHGTRPR
jgi:hypothetical protein